MAAIVTILTLDGYVSTKGAAKLAGYSRRMVRHLIETGELSAERKGQRAWKIKVDDLHACLTGRCRIRRIRID